jgi:hypothetical protein
VSYNPDALGLAEAAAANVDLVLDAKAYREIAGLGAFDLG